MRKKNKRKHISKLATAHDFGDTSAMELKPAWVRAKNKQLSYQLGYHQGRRDEQQSKHDQVAKQKQEDDRFEQRTRLEVVRQIAQAGSSIVEGITKALLAYDKNL